MPWSCRCHCVTLECHISHIILYYIIILPFFFLKLQMLLCYSVVSHYTIQYCHTVSYFCCIVAADVIVLHQIYCVQLYNNKLSCYTIISYYHVIWLHMHRIVWYAGGCHNIWAWYTCSWASNAWISPLSLSDLLVSCALS